MNKILLIISFIGFCTPFYYIRKIFKQNNHLLKNGNIKIINYKATKLSLFHIAVLFIVIYLASILQFISNGNIYINTLISLMLMYFTILIFKQNDVIYHSRNDDLLLTLMALWFASIEEEIRFRILPYLFVVILMNFNVLNNLVFSIVYVIFTSILFGIHHKNSSLVHVVLMTFFGAILGIIILEHGVFSSICIHSAYNFICLPGQYKIKISH
ncbi:hypothetical protein BBF96_08120 [Anoxybacter fermentans]|uniref:CAAX prenyl protease 2/Lysostaphin resistance protein A-like domain-containing protein n=1 Tax=Anoxybacter fermentans TaxID=1323375 RepID=A0A3S9SYK6_9FIRM|nr:CPBP family intramembrane glutamic endopeptidase [Anoxybacter fermentans]AZR73350.1 hypothetical protein BBF96_08120 [Anoxybacter fermentans]